MLTSSAAGRQPTGRPKGEIGIGLRGSSNRLGFLAVVLDDFAVELDNAHVEEVECDMGDAIERELEVNGCIFWAGDFGIGDKVFDGRTLGTLAFPPLRPLDTVVHGFSATMPSSKKSPGKDSRSESSASESQSST